jgi:hypothetical protein
MLVGFFLTIINVVKIRNVYKSLIIPQIFEANAVSETVNAGLNPLKIEYGSATLVFAH